MINKNLNLEKLMIGFGELIIIQIIIKLIFRMIFTKLSPVSLEKK